MSAAGTCGVSGVTCTYSGTTADYASDPCDSSVRVFDIASRKQTDHINVGGCFRTDEGAFDPVDQIALFANPSEQPGVNSKRLNQSAFVTFISTAPVAPGEHHKILQQINFDGKAGTVHADMGIEQAVYSSQTGLFYLNIPGASSNAAGYVVVLDPRISDDIKIVDTYKLKPIMVSGTLTYCAPTGGALGPNYEMLLGCSNPGAPEEVIDIRDGKVLKVLTGTSGGCDEVWYNAGDDLFRRCMHRQHACRYRRPRHQQRRPGALRKGDQHQHEGRTLRHRGFRDEHFLAACSGRNWGQCRRSLRIHPVRVDLQVNRRRLILRKCGGETPAL
jgi:hypothetical protein